MPILLEAALRVRHVVEKTRINRGDQDIIAFKNTLDRTAQEAIVTTLREKRINANIVSEEGNCILGVGGDETIILDPIDGTTNMARGLNPAVTSIAVSETTHQSGVYAGLVMNLYNGAYYRAEKGCGAFHGDAPITTSPPIDVDEAMLSLDISKKPRLERVSGILDLNQHLRFLGCSAMSLCHVASGIIDAHLDIRGILRATDVAAGLLILREAGGVYSIDGETFGDMPLTRVTNFELIAANKPPLLRKLRRLTE
ncbi:MAG: inositol monophosphatase family protein [Candidatus Bathyarchaeia archaeon]